MCWLQYEDGLHEEEDAGAVKEGVRGEENEVIEEDVGPDGGDEEDYAGLGDYCCA